MAALSPPHGSPIFLRSRHIAGRSASCNLRLVGRQVSALHAQIYWERDGWFVRDLGSRNGTWVNGRQLDQGGTAPLKLGAAIGFGRSEPVWKLMDVDPPQPFAIAADRVEVGSFGVLALPDEDAPTAMIYQSGGGWILQSEETSPASDMQTVDVDGVTWQLQLPEEVPATLRQNDVPRLDDIEMRFAVSLDEEYVASSLHSHGWSSDLGARAHYHTLLHLARARLEDQGNADLPESARGWVYADQLGRDLGFSEGKVNLHIFKARRQLEALGVAEAARVVERRPQTQQLRLGLTQIEIVRG